MLSSLARGYGSWTGDFDLCSENEETADYLPLLGIPEPHRHGITVSPRTPSATSVFTETTDGKLDLPKTYITRKGALVLFSAPDEDSKKVASKPPRFVRHKKTNEMIDLSLKLGTLERLSLSVLQYGEEDFDRENSSISDKNNKLFMKFLHKAQAEDIHSQPGGDLRFYLRDLRSRASGRFYGSNDSSSPKSEELREILRELEEAWCRLSKPGSKEPFVNTSVYSDRSSSKQRVLSSKKLTESLKSGKYLGRPYSAVSSASQTDPDDFGDQLSDIGSHPRSRSAHSKSGIWVRSGSVSEAASPVTTASRRPGSSSRSYSAKSRQSRLTSPAEGGQDDSKSTDQTPDGEENWIHSVVVEVDKSATHGSRRSSVSRDEDLSEAVHPLHPQYSGTLADIDDTGSESNQFATSDNDELSAGHKVYNQDTSYLSETQEDEKDISVQPRDDESSQFTDQDRTLESDDKTLPAVSTSDSSPGDKQDLQHQDNSTSLQISSEGKDDEAEEEADQTGLKDGAAGLGDVEAGLKDQAGLEEDEARVKDVEEESKDLSEELLQEDENKENVLEAKDAGDDAKSGGMEEPVQMSVDSLSKPEPQTLVSELIERTADDGQPKQQEQSIRSDSLSQQVDNKKKEESVLKDNREITQQKSKSPSPKESEAVIPPEEKNEVKTLEPRPPEGKSPKQKSSPRGVKSEKKQPIRQKGGPVKSFVKALDISSVQHEDTTSQEVPKAEIKPEKPQQPKRPPARHVETKKDKTKSDVLPEHIADVMQRRSASQSAQDLEEDIMQMHEAISGTLSGPTLETEFGEGLTSEELQLAQEALQDRLKEAKERMENVLIKTPRKPEKPKMKQAQGKKGRRKAAQPSEEEKRDIRREREAIKEKQRMDKMKRLEEARRLQEEIAKKEEERIAKEEEMKTKAKEIQERMEELEREAEEIRQAEEDAHQQLQLARKYDREERERRRKEDLERKKQQAIARREKQRAMMEEARKKELEMLMQITDAEMKAQLEEEERARREEEEQVAQEMFEEELRQAQLQAEEDEIRMRELEKEAEEEAMKRLVEEREKAEREKWALAEKQRHLEAEARRKQELIMEEEKRLEEEQFQKEEEEKKLKEEEKRRLEELQRLEAIARETLNQEIERRREWAMLRREKNLENRLHLDKIRHSQGMTKPWVFSYFVQWPRETYCRLMGEDPKKKKPAGKPKPKPKPAAETGDATTSGEAPAS